MDVGAGPHYIHAVPETHVMNEASKLKGQPVVLEVQTLSEGVGLILPKELLEKLGVKPGDAVELRPAQDLSPEERRQKVMTAGRKIMDEYETTFRILAK